jgi:hypothetical protein
VRIATWNVNSLRSRIDRVERFLERHDVDVLALQETKAREDQLPLMGLQALGYDVVVSGTNQWNGVAIVSRVGIEDVEEGFPGQPGWGEPAEPESRALGATCGGVRLWSLYVPNGRKPDDPHYVYKLDWLARLREACGVPGVPRRRLRGRGPTLHAGAGRVHVLGLLPPALRAEPGPAHRLRARLTDVREQGDGGLHRSRRA